MVVGLLKEDLKDFIQVVVDDPKVKAKAVGLAADRGFGKGGAR